MSSDPDFHAVIFDMDGLILDTEPIYRAAWQWAATSCGFTLTDKDYAEWCVGRTDADAEIVLMTTIGPDFPTVRFRELKLECWWEHVNSHGVALKPGVLEVLDFLDARRIPRAVASSTHNQEVRRLLAEADLASRFDAIVGGDEVTQGKPAPDIFLKAAARLGASPQQCLVLEDSENGVRAAHAAGAWPIIVPDLKEPSPEVAALARLILPSLREVRQFLEGRLTCELR